MAKTMAEVLAEHWSASTHTDHEPPVDQCDGCGAVLRKWGDDSDMPAQLAAHQAAALSAAGYGLVADAKREALEEAADHLEEDASQSSYRDHEAVTQAQLDAGEYLRARAAEMRQG